MFDVLQIIFWSVTYVLIIIFSYGAYFKGIGGKMIPAVPAMLNISWELIALATSRGFWGHWLWLSLDVLIYIYIYVALTAKYKKFLYALASCMCVMIFAQVFQLERGMLVSSFVIDLIMAVCFWAERKTIQRQGRLLIAITKLIGDLCAAIYYAPELKIVFCLSVCVLVLNCSYFVYCLKNRKSERRTE